jgi:hypothetical protein
MAGRFRCECTDVLNRHLCRFPLATIDVSENCLGHGIDSVRDRRLQLTGLLEDDAPGGPLGGPPAL